MSKSKLNVSKYFIFYGVLFSLACTLFIFLSGFRSVATDSGTLPETPPQGFCQTKTDYNSNFTCSNNMFVASNMSDLQSYQSNFGQSGTQYRNLRIAFALSGSEFLIHSPCKISIAEGLTHNVTRLCLDGKKEVKIEPRTIVMSDKIHILSMDGHSIVQDSSVLQANELEVFATGKTHINQGARLSIQNSARVVSTYQGDVYTGVRWGPGSVAEANGFTLIGYGVINFNSMSLTARGALSVESKGARANNKVNIVQRSNIRGGSVSIVSGNGFEMRSRSFLRAEQNAHVAAMGCLVQRNTTIEASTYSGSCLNAGRVNQIPVVMVGGSPLSGLIPLTVNFNSTGTNDPDGEIDSYTWTFPDNSTASGPTARYIFTEAGAYMVKLMVEDDDGAMAEKEILVTATAPLVSPTASFTFTPSSGEAPLTVSFDGSASSDPDGEIASYQWIFSHGEALSGVTTQRTFERAGEYRVSLRVTDSDGLTHQTSESVITVEESNFPPALVGDQSIQAKQNKPIEFSLSGAIDPDGDPLTYFIVNNVTSGTLSDCLEGTSDLDCIYTPADDLWAQLFFPIRPTMVRGIRRQCPS